MVARARPQPQFDGSALDQQPDLRPPFHVTPRVSSPLLVPPWGFTHELELLKTRIGNEYDGVRRVFKTEEYPQMALQSFDPAMLSYMFLPLDGGEL